MQAPTDTTTTVADAIRKARAAAIAQGGDVLLLVTLATGERLVCWVRPDGAQQIKLIADQGGLT